MGKPAKITLAFVAAIILLVIAFYGNFLPLRKSQTLIDSLRNVQGSKSIADFKNTISTALDFPSPVGQEESVRNVASVVMGVVQQTSDPQVITDLVGYIEGYYKPIIDQGAGMSFGQNLYVLGATNELAFVKTKQPQFLTAAQNYFAEGLRMAPKRPQFLYGMFDVYRIEGNVDGAKGIAAQILTYWPNDDRIKSGLADFLAKVAEVNAQQKAKQK